MSYRRTLFAALLSLTITSSYAVAGQPLSTEDAGVVERGHLEIEVNGTIMKDRETIDGSLNKKTSSLLETKLSTGINSDTGIAMILPYTITAHDNGVASDGFGDITLELKKYLGDFSGVHLAVKPSVTLATGADRISEHHTQLGGTLIASKNLLNDVVALHLNLGVRHATYAEDDGSKNRTIWSSSVAIEGDASKNLTLAAEIGNSRKESDTDNHNPAFAMVGGRYAVTEMVSLSAGVRMGLTTNEDDIRLLYGMIVRF